ncbi:phospholipase D-like domain-containing protein DpdK [Saccharothrix obliqua]|uniref:phospholipase D-like domain-containing protein DpdK n=1 Tax=Saccharothrix obliqua TaxID=2861747 RepID=UPI001C6042B6|nr:phospholipase D-like domain-containing protein DpdK [Saccharothrix obliqua]MBW4717522.1 phospholipase D family protein [Saccharothrix obliqua]
MTTRLIHRTAASPNRDIAECLEGLLLSELLDPGRRLLVVSPWMSDFPAMDNRGGKFSIVEPTWTATWVPFSAVLRGLLLRGVEVNVACGPGRAEKELLERVRQGAALDGTVNRLVSVHLSRERRQFSHEKALVADGWAVYGSMNLTFSGVSINGELITVTTDGAPVAAVTTELLGLFA